MCGICGFTGEVIDRDKVIKNMTDVITHRGPDSDGSSLIDEANKQLFDCVDMNKDGKLSVADVTALQIQISQNN